MISAGMVKGSVGTCDVIEEGKRLRTIAEVQLGFDMRRVRWCKCMYVMLRGSISIEEIDRQ
jgi:hypothetical protein